MVSLSSSFNAEGSPLQKDPYSKQDSFSSDSNPSLKKNQETSKDSSITTRGLVNITNTCYLNAVFMAILHLPTLRDFFNHFLSSLAQKEGEAQNSFGHRKVLQGVVYDMLCRAEQGVVSAFDTKLLKSTLNLCGWETWDLD